MSLSLFLQKLYEDMGLGPLPSPTEEGVYKMDWMDEVTVQAHDLKPGIALETVVSPFVHKKKEELLIYLMKANFLCQGTGRSCLGLDKEEKSLTLSLSFPYEMDYKMFQEVLEDFVNYAQFWKKKLASLKALEEQIV